MTVHNPSTPLEAARARIRIILAEPRLPANVGAAEKLPALPLTLAERIVPAETIAALIEGETNPRSRVLLRVLYYGGLRESEACGLRWRDVQARADRLGPDRDHRYQWR